MGMKNLQRYYILYLFLQKFYAGELNRLDFETWENLIQSLQQDCMDEENETIWQGLRRFVESTSEQQEQLEFAFNSLFVGPGKLLAPPYESAYLNENRVLMQQETLSVRKFYEKAGLELICKNHEPDDHIAFELEFVCYLLGQYLQTKEKEMIQMYHTFLKTHLFRWAGVHCEAIREHSDHPICLGIADLLDGLIQNGQTEETMKEGNQNG